MGRHWERNEIDLCVLKMLDKYKALRGLTLVGLALPGGNRQKVYDRLKAMKTLELIDSIPYLGYVEIRGCTKHKQIGKLYFLMTKGVTEVKKMKGQAIDGTERNQRPEENQMDSLWDASLIIENIDLEFENPRRYKAKYGFSNFFMIDLVYGQWQIVVQKDHNQNYRNKLLHQSIYSVENGCDQRVILCPTRAKLATMLKMWTREHGPNTRFMLKGDYLNLRRVIEESSLAEIEDTIRQSGLEVTKLETPVAGCKYKIDGILTNIVDLVGNPARQIRQLKKISNSCYVGFASEVDKEQIEKMFPEILNSHTPVILGQTFEEECDPWAAEGCNAY